MRQPESGMEILYLTQQDVIDVGLSSLEVLELVRMALTEHGHKRYEMPAKIGIHPLKGSLMHAMPAWVPAAQACGIKWIECFPDNYKCELPQTSGLMILNSPETGWPVCILDATWVTAKRTPAVTALACEVLARKDVEVAGLIGAGVQGGGHVLMLPGVLPKLKRIRITDRFPTATKRLVHDLQPKVPKIELVECKTIEEVVRGALVVVSATSILAEPTPEVHDEWVEPGAFIAPIDFDSLWERETFSRADKFLVDSVDEMKHLTTVGRLRDGLPPLHAELGEVVAGLKPGRERDEELIIDMNIGMAVEDVVVGWELFKRACRLNLGRSLPL
jgi:ornithine cyclodeaminase/alanine dehydrogenase